MSNKSNLTVKDWAEEDRPREKMISKGKKELSNAELLAILISSGSTDQNVVDLSKEILSSVDNSLSLLSRQEIGWLTKTHKGIGPAKAISIIAALELGYRMLREDSDTAANVIQSSSDLFQYISASLIDLPYEEFWAVYLNQRGKVICKQRISAGGITETPVDIRIIFKTALERNAVSVAVCHNHPSGALKPSNNDIKLTEALKTAANALKINLIEHIIVGITDRGKPDYYSFYDNGIL